MGKPHLPFLHHLLVLIMKNLTSDQLYGLGSAIVAIGSGVLLSSLLVMAAHDRTGHPDNPGPALMLSGFLVTASAIVPLAIGQSLQDRERYLRVCEIDRAIRTRRMGA